MAVDDFLAEYVDVHASSDRLGEELMMLPLGFVGAEDDLPSGQWEWVAITSLEQALDLGFRQPRRAFRLYLRSLPGWAGCVLAFTHTGGIVFGLSIDDPQEDPATLALAERAMVELVRRTGGTKGWVAVEAPPPLMPDSERPWESAPATCDASP